MTYFTDKEEIMEHVLADCDSLNDVITGKNRVIDKLQAENKMYKTELDDVKDLASQLKAQQMFMIHELADIEKEMKAKLKANDETYTVLKELCMKQSEKEKIIDDLQADLTIYQDNAKYYISQLEARDLSTKQQVADKEKEVMEKLGEKDVELAEVKEELIVKQNVLTENKKIIDDLEADLAIYKNNTKYYMRQLEMRDLWAKEWVAIKECEIMEKLREKDVALTELKEELIVKQTALTENKKIIDDLEADLAIYKNNTKYYMRQLEMRDLWAKEWVAIKECEMMEKLRVKDVALTELKEELVVKQNALSDINITVSKISNELEEQQKESWEQLDKISVLQHEVEEKEKELTATKSEMANLNHQLTEKCDLLIDMTTDRNTLQNVLADKERTIDDLQAELTMAMYRNNTKYYISQLEIKDLSIKQQLADKDKEMMEKLREKDVALAELKEQLMVKQMYNNKAKYALRKLETDISSVKQEFTDYDKEMEEKMRVKDEALAKLKEELILKQNSLENMCTKHSTELEVLQNEIQEQLYKSSILQQEVVVKEKESVAAKGEVDNLNLLLKQRYDSLQSVTADKETMQNVLADKEKIIDDLQEDLAIYKNNAKYYMHQLEVRDMSTKQRLADKEKETMEKLRVKDIELAKLKKELIEREEHIDICNDEGKQFMTELKMDISSVKQTLAKYEKEMRVKDEALASLKEELIMKQNSLNSINIIVSKISNKLEEQQKENQKQAMKILDLQQQVAVKEEELVATRSEISNLHHQLVQQSDNLSGVIADKKRTIELADNKKEMIEKLREKDEVMAELKEELMMKQTSLDDIVSRHSDELNELKRENQKQINDLMQQVAEKEEELAEARSEVSDLQQHLKEQSDLLSVERADK